VKREGETQSKEDPEQDDFILKSGADFSLIAALRFPS
jgi:hypothetical protein